jgi:hypothetical protein
MIEVINMNRCPGFGKKPGDCRADRKTKWGNPFIMYETSKRNLVCDLYEDYLDTITTPGEEDTVKILLRLGGLTPIQIEKWMFQTGGYLDISDLKDARRLGCWCKDSSRKDGGPRCHCDYLKKKIEELTQPGLDKYE